MAWQYGINLGNNAGTYGGIEKLRRFSAMEIQFGVDDCPVDRSGRAFTPTGEAPGDYLRAGEVDVAHYVCPQFSHAAAVIGRPSAGAGGPGRDPYWLRLATAEAADKYGWWLRCEDDGRLPTGLSWGGRPLYPLDVANPDYRAWFVETVTKYRGARHTLRFDCGWLGGGYETLIKCPLCRDRVCRYSRSAAELTAGLVALYDALRAAGWRVVVNMGWEMTNPQDPPAQWRYPLMPHVDGVMMEVGGAVYVDGRWIGETDERRRAVMRAWMDAGKIFIYAGHWNHTIPGKFKIWQRYHIAEAQRYGYRAGVSRYGLSTWEDWFGNEKPAPLFPMQESSPPLREVIVHAAVAAFCLRVNPQAALARRAWADGYQVSGNEAYPVVDGVRYVTQYADARSDVHRPRAYYVEVDRAGEPDAIQFFEVDDMEQPHTHEVNHGNQN